MGAGSSVRDYALDHRAAYAAGVMLDLVINSAVTHGLLLILPLLCALLLRWARCPGWPVVGGAVAGILLGPTLLGRIDPERFERHFIGGIAEREALNDLHHQRAREAIAPARLKVAPGDQTQHLEPFDLRIAAAEAAWRRAQWKFQRPFRSYTSAAVALALLGAGLLRVRSGDRRQSNISSISIGIWAAVLPGALAFLALRNWWNVELGAALLTAGAVGIGPWMLTNGDRKAANDAEVGGAHMVQRAGRIASIFAIIAAGIGMSVALDGARALWGASLVALPLGWLLPAMTQGSRAESIVRAILNVAIVPTLTACVALRIELFDHFAFWMIVIFVFLSGDVRWIGALIGALLPGGRAALRTMRLVIGSMACGVTQISIAALGIHAGALPGSVALGLLIGALVIEVSTPARRTMADRLAETEAELDRADDEL